MLLYEWSLDINIVGLVATARIDDTRVIVMRRGSKLYEI